MDEELILTEATAVSADVPEELPGNASDERWNELYKKYLNPSATKYFLIKVEGFGRKTAVEGEPASGFIKFTGETGVGKTKKVLFFGGKNVDVVNSTDVSVVEHESDASVFQQEDAQKIIDAIKRNKDFKLKGAQFTLQNASQETVNAVDISKKIITAYFDVLAGSGLGEKLTPALTQLDTICRRMKTPLVGNPLFNMLKSILTNGDSRFVVNNKSVLMLNNFVADRIFRSNDIINPSTFLASLTYNNTLYNNNEERVKELFKIYDKVKDLDTSELTNERLRELGVESKQIARHVLVDTGNGSDADNFETIVKKIGDTWEETDLENIGYKPEGDLVSTWRVRTVEQANDLYNTLFAESDLRDDEDRKPVLYLQFGDNVKDLKNVSDDEGDITGEFVNVSISKEMEIRVVKASSTSKGDKTLPNLLKTLPENYFTDSEFIELKDGKFIAKKDFTSTIKIETKLTKVEGKKVDVLRKFDITGEASVVRDEDEAEEEAAEEEVAAEGISAEERFAGKTISEIAAMSKDEFKTFKAALTPEEASRLKSFGGRFLGI